MSGSDTNGAQTAQFIVFSDDWGVHPSSCQHIFRHIVQEHEVTWINTIGMRPPRMTLADVRKIFQKASRMLSGRRKSVAGNPEKLTVIQPVMLPYMSNGLVRRFNRWSVARSLRRNGTTDPSCKTIVLTTVPNAADYVDLIPAHLVVYYCVDDFSEWPGLDKHFILGLEGQLVDKVNLIFATSPGLQSRLAKSGKPVMMLEHGVDVAHFSHVAEAEHPSLEKIGKPRVGFFGLIDGRMDADTLRYLAECLPNVNFVLAGPAEISTSALDQFDNIHFVGRLPYAELPAFIRGIDALIIPYKVDALANALSPLKLKEYLATGKPVVSSAIPASVAFDQLVHIAASRREWKELVQNAVISARDDVRSHSPVVFDGESWIDKANLLLNSCLDHDSQPRG